MSIRSLGQTKINNLKNAIINLITAHNSSSSAHSTEMAKKVNVAQGSGNKNKNVVTDSSGNITTEAKPTIPTKTSDLTNDSNFVSSINIDNKEDTSNKVSSWSSTTNDTHYPSEKLVKDSLDGKANASHTHGKIQSNGKILNNNNSYGAGVIISGLDGLITVADALTNTRLKDAQAHSNIGTAANATQGTINASIDTALGNKSNINHTHTKTDITDFPTIPTKTSDLTNNSGFLTSHQDISGKEDTSNKVSSWSTTTTDDHYPSEKLVKDSLDRKAASTHNHTKSQITDFPSSMTPTSHASTSTTYGAASTTNYGHAKLSTSTSSTSTSLAATPSAVKAAYDLANGKANASHTHGKADITDFPTIPSKTSDLTNDSGFLTSHQDISGKEDTSNKVSSWSSTTTDAHYPSEKLVKTALDGKAASDHTHSNYLTSHQDISGKIDTAGTGLSKSGTTLNHSNSITAQTSNVFKKFKYDAQGHITGTANVTSADLPSHTHSQYLTSHQSLDSKTVTVEKQSTAESGYIATYVVKQNNAQVGVKINIPKDYLVKSATVNTCATTGTPSGFTKGDKYIDFVVNTKDDTSGTGDHIYLNVNDLVDAYTAGAGLELTNSNEFKHSNSVTAQTSLGFKKIKYDATGHITGTSDVTASDLPTHYHSQYLTSHQDITGKVDKAQGSSNASKNVVTDSNGNITVEAKPTIPSKTSDLTNDSGYLVSSDISGKIDTAGSGLSKNGTTLNHSNSVTALTTASLKKVKYDAQGHITGTADVSGTDLPSHTHNYAASDHNHDGTYLKTAQTSYKGKNVVVDATSGNITFENKPTIPSKTSDLTNDSGFLTSHQTIPTGTTSTAGIVQLEDSYSSTSTTKAATPNAVKAAYDLANGKAASSHSHGSLTNGGTLNSDITTVNKVAVTDSSNNLKTISKLPYSKISGTPTIPTKTSDLTNDSGFLTSHQSLSNYVQTDDSRLSDARTPTSHTHTKSEISDFPSTMTPSSHAHGDITNAGAIGSTANKPIITTTNGKLTTGSFGTSANTFCQGNDSRLSDARTPTAHTHTKSEISDFPTSMTPTSHTHGNLTNDGKLGTTSGKPVITTTGGAITTGSFGTNSGQFAEGNHEHTINDVIVDHGGALYTQWGSAIIEDNSDQDSYILCDSLLQYSVSDYSIIYDNGTLDNQADKELAVKADIPTHTSQLSNDSGFLTSHQSLANYVQTNDSRLSDARTPTSHTHTKSEISDFPTSMTPTSHTHDTSEINLDYPAPVTWKNNIDSTKIEITDGTRFLLYKYGPFKYLDYYLKVKSLASTDHKITKTPIHEDFIPTSRIQIATHAAGASYQGALIQIIGGEASNNGHVYIKPQTANTAMTLTGTIIYI